MAEIPDSMDALVYFTRRALGKGKLICWAERLPCPKCKTLMSKPLDEKKGTFKTRSQEYVCPGCGYAEQKGEHEAKLTATVLYTCPFCNHAGEAEAPFARKTWYGKKAIVFQCSECGEKLGVTKKLATPAPFQAKLDGKSVRETDTADLDEDDDF